MSVDAAGMARQTEDALSRLPKIAGAAQQPGFSAASSAVLNGAEEEMRKMGDEYISVEHLFLALLDKPDYALRQILSAFPVHNNILYN